ncbi:MAG: methylenetetrahydrofolate reductase [bacterium]
MNLKEALLGGKFAVTSEMAPPKGTDMSEVKEKTKLVLDLVDGINVTDMQSAVLRVTSLATCKVMKDLGADPVFQITCRDRNRLAMQGELLSVAVMGINNVLVLTGDHPQAGDHPEAKPVFDFDSVSFLQMVSKLMSGQDMTDHPLTGVPNFFLGASVTPKMDPLEPQIIKSKKKVQAGAKFFQTQGVYDMDTMKTYMDAVKPYLGDTKVMAGIIPLKSAGMAKFMNKNIPGINIPQSIIDRMAAATDAVEEGIKIAGEFIDELKQSGVVDGVHIMAIGAEERVPDIMRAGGLIK